MRMLSRQRGPLYTAAEPTGVIAALIVFVFGIFYELMAMGLIFLPIMLAATPVYLKLTRKNS